MYYPADMSAENVLVIDDSPTILKVVQLVLTKAGFQVATAPDGEAGVSSAREKRPDLILLDFVMPRMNGYQVCRTLSADEKLKDVPVVLMSAKGDQVGERFVKVMGIVDYITKPFSPEAITAVVQHTIQKFAKGDRAAPILEVNDPGTGDTAIQQRENEAARKQAIKDARDAIAAAVAPRVGELVGLAQAAADGDAGAESKVTIDQAAIADAARAALDDAVLGGILGAAKPGIGGDDGDAPALQGDLRVVPIADVLQLLATQAQSGVLQMTRAKGRVEVYFRQGRVDFAGASNISEEFLLGRFIVDLQLMSKTDIESYLRSRVPGTKLIGSQLVKLGYISDSELKQAITKQTCELIYEALRWNFGRFTFKATRDLPPIAVDASLNLELDGILMEGFRRVDEWHLIEREIDNFDVVFLRNEDTIAQMGRGRLTREEQAILELANGKNTVKEIIRQSRMGSFDVSKMLYRLLSIKLIRRRVLPVAV
jgi:CheY-like chemotaxis protein